MKHQCRQAYLLLVLLILMACQGGSRQANSLGQLALSVETTQDFNPNAVHGEINQYKVTITGENLAAPIVKYFGKDETAASFDGFPSGSKINIQLEYINVNGVVVRRGVVNAVPIQGGLSTAVRVTVNNVPIFANVRDGASVVANHFVPKIFAPGEISFSLSDTVNGDTALLQDVVTAETLFAISTTDETSVMPIHIPALSPGIHELTVRDPNTGESSRITVTVLAAADRTTQPTTAGGYVGSLSGAGVGNGFDLIHYEQLSATNK